MAEEKNYTEVLLEDLNSQFKAFGEGLDIVSQQTEKNSKQLKELTKEVRDFRAEVGVLRHDIKKEFSLLRREIFDLRSLLGTKADVARLEALEARVDRLERSVQPAS